MTTDDENPEGPRPPWVAMTDNDPAPGIDNEPSEPPTYPEPNGRSAQR